MENQREQQEILFKTERLQRELLNMNYVEEIFKELTDAVTKYLRVPTPTDIQQEIDRIIKSQETYEKGENINFIVTDEAGDFIGTGGVMHLDTATPELGLRIKESARGKGYGKEMIAKLINRIEEHKEFDHIIYRAHIENIATRKIAERFGGVLQRDEAGNEKRFTDRKFDKSSSFEAVEYRIYPKA